jgi:hypothetical protein
MTFVFGGKVERGAVPGVEARGRLGHWPLTGEGSGELRRSSRPVRALRGRGAGRGAGKGSERGSATLVLDGVTVGPEAGGDLSCPSRRPRKQRPGRDRGVARCAGDGRAPGAESSRAMNASLEPVTALAREPNSPRNLASEPMPRNPCLRSMRRARTLKEDVFRRVQSLRV